MGTHLPVLPALPALHGLLALLALLTYLLCLRGLGEPPAIATPLKTDSKKPCRQSLVREHVHMDMLCVCCIDYVKHSVYTGCGLTVMHPFVNPHVLTSVKIHVHTYMCVRVRVHFCLIHV